MVFSSFGELPGGMEDFLVHLCDIYPMEIKGNYVLTSSLVVRKEQAGDALRFAEDIPVYEDWECFARLGKRGKGIFLDCDTVIQHGHGEGRLTDASTVVTAKARLAIIERIWGMDSAYLSENSGTYKTVLQEVQQQLIKELLCQGATRDARFRIREMRKCPMFYKLLSRVPELLTRNAYQLYRMVKQTRVG
jgi:hypothetical protein